jgi:alanyl-tRNA synthetase
MVATERLYFRDPYLTGFAARIVARGEWRGRTAVALDRTAFYPEGGGQPADHGMLDAARVVDVQAGDDGVIWHVIEGEPDGDLVQGQVDWPRRFDHMQQHHGQHLLSAAFEELFALPTVSFHLGAESATIDLEGDATEEQFRAAESRVNEIIWEDRPVELAAIPLRKPPAVTGPVRVVSVPGFDHSACGGTHPRSTGAVGLLHVRRREKRGAATRVEFVCGGRALRDLRVRGGLVTRLAAEFTLGVDELEDAVARLRADRDAARKKLAVAMERVLACEARALVAQASRRADGVPVVSVIRDDLSLDEGRWLVRAVAAEGGIAVVGLRGPKAQLLLGRADGMDLDCGKVIREVLSRFGGKGGGSQQVAQGGLPEGVRVEDGVKAAAALVIG